MSEHMTHPLATELRLSGGQVYQVDFCMLGLMHAEERHNFDSSGVEMDPETAKKEAEEAPKSQRFRLMLTPVWLGVLADSPDTSLEDLARLVRTYEDMREIGRVFAHIMRYQAERPDIDQEKKSEDAGP